jgi:hypothetical protein
VSGLEVKRINRPKEGMERLAEAAIFSEISDGMDASLSMSGL